ncbi:uncharacterized protein LOC105428338 [Pogonomyrmex barbatus]|uniref:Uncharacterized protein LOC105428338 n=1 Tax=Pogonomyrmex barbatus TaxID=144034 RepID=A0A6I9W9H6_9HYME|nr:uncharacterized protein LOC105428338 [Pogonomyrmex barbatus]
MFFVLPRILSRSNCILILVISNFASSAPLKSWKRSPHQSEHGFSTVPKILEIQLPLKISTKEDLIAWSRYVTSLMTSKINFTSTTLKNSPSVERRVPFVNNSGLKSKEMMKEASLNEKRQGVNYPARRLKEPPVERADDKVVAYPLPVGAMKMSTPSPQDSSTLPNLNINGPIDFGQYMDFNIGNPFQQTELDTFGNFEILAQPPAAMYLPLPLTTTNTAKSYQNNKNTSGFEEPAKLQTTRTSQFRVKANNKLGQVLPTDVNEGLIGTNLSHIGEPLLTFPFQALITITKEVPEATISKTQPRDYSAINIKNSPNEFSSQFGKNHTLMNESAQVNVVLNDFVTGTGRAKTKGSQVKKEEQKKGEQNARGQKKQNEKKTKNVKKKKTSSIKRQAFVLGDLLRTLGILRKLPKNTTEINVATPVLSILKGTNTQKIQVAFEEVSRSQAEGHLKDGTPPPLPSRERRNETFLAQQLDDDDDNDENEETEENEENDEQMEAQLDDDDDEEEEEEGGSIQTILDLLPVAAPILEDLSDPESDVDLAEVLQAAIPLLEGLSDPDEEGGIDIPGVLVPLSQRLSEGPDGQGSDSGAILGPLIQLIAPLIGPLVGPLIGPLSRTSSGPGGKEGSASALAAASGPLSQPEGAYGQSILSGLVASITARLSKELAASAGESDVKSLVSAIVSGVLAGASAGSSGQKGYSYNKPNHRPDTYYAPTTYGGYDSYAQTPAASSSSLDVLLGPLKEILGAFLKLSATSSTSSANLSGTSSSSSTSLSASSSQSSQEPPKPTYGAPTHPPYAPPSYAPPSMPAYSPPASTNSPYVSFVRRQVARKQIKRF